VLSFRKQVTAAQADGLRETPVGAWSRLCFHQLANSQVNLDCFGRKLQPRRSPWAHRSKREAGERVRPETLGYGDVGGIPISPR